MVALVVVVLAFFGVAISVAQPANAQGQPIGAASTNLSSLAGSASASGSAPSAPLADNASPAATSPTFTPTGYVEGAYQFNANRPSNGVSNFRLDNRHNAFGILNAALGGTWGFENVSGKILLQLGQTPSTYYAGEPAAPGAPGVAPTNGSYWSYLQEAWLGVKFNVGQGLLVQGGLFTSPVGFEVIPVKDNWNFSRGTLFYALPFYHTGLKFSQSLSDKLTLSLMGFNGWNSVGSDNNSGKSAALQLAYADGENLNWSVLYFGGPERSTGAPEGQPWRSDLDAWLNIAAVSDRLWLGAHGNAGTEKTSFGADNWLGGAGYVKLKATPWLFFAARGDVLYEKVPTNTSGVASPIFFPASTVHSQTVTADFRPANFARVFLEFRRDNASSNMYGKGDIPVDPKTGLALPNAKNQNTISFGFVGWL